jgi:RHS repeat-associated protein
MWYTLDCLAAARTGFIHSDHLGSTSLTTDISGTVVAETRYLPYGEERWITGTLVTDFTFTGQRAERGFALMDYNARYYDPGLGRFVSAECAASPQGIPWCRTQATHKHSIAMRMFITTHDDTWTPVDITSLKSRQTGMICTLFIPLAGQRRGENPSFYSSIDCRRSRTKVRCSRKAVGGSSEISLGLTMSSRPS